MDFMLGYFALREKINKLANGILTSTPFISVEPKELNLELAPGKTQKCEIDLISHNSQFIKGLAYSSDTRVTVFNPSFGGIDAKVITEVTLKNTDDEKEYKFHLSLITNGGEFLIPISVQKQSVSSDDVLLNLSSIEDFARIAYEDSEAALKIFEYSNFYKAPFMSDLRNRALYSSLIQSSDHKHALEQFLFACGIDNSISKTNNELFLSDRTENEKSDSFDTHDDFEIDRKLYFKKHYSEFARLRLFLEINNNDAELLDAIEDELVKLSSFSSFSVTAALYRAEAEYCKGNSAMALRLINSVTDSVLSNRQDNIKDYFLYEYLDIVINNKSSKVSSFLRLCRKFIEEEKLHYLFYYVVKLDNELRENPSALHAFLMEVYGYGCRSPFLYYFNTILINSNPEFLFNSKSIDNQTINFARKYNILSENIGTAVLNASCSAFIKADRRSVSVHKTYSDAIDADLNIIGLYEYYMYSIPKDINYVISDKVINHYKNEDSLDVSSKIRLYSNIVKFKNHNSTVFRSYENRIYKLAYQQLKEGNIDIYLADLYKGSIKTDALDKEMAGELIDITNTYLIHTDNKYLKSILVVYPQYSEPAVYPVSNGQANVTIYDLDAELLFLDVFGNRHYNISYKKDPLLDSYTLKNASERLCQNHPYIKTRKATDLISKKSLSADDVVLLESILFDLHLSEGFKAQIINRLIQYYNLHTANGYNPEFLLRINKKNLNRSERQDLCNAYISCNCFNEAYEMISQFGFTGILPKNARYLCSNLISLNMHTEDLLLLHLASKCFEYNVIDNSILDFLARKFNGLSDTMYQINTKCIDCNVETYDLEERLLAQYIFINDYKNLDKVFNRYVSRKKVSESLVKAYFTVKTADYFINNIEIDSSIFSYLEDTIDENGNVEDIPVLYRLALLKQYSVQESLTDLRVSLSRKFIFSLSEKNIVFPFYLKFSKYFELPESIRNTIILVYKTQNGVEPLLYSRITPFEKTLSQDVFSSKFMNMFIKSKLLFSDEIWNYEITDADGVVLHKGNMSKKTAPDGVDRYTLIDKLCKDFSESNGNSCIRQVRDYLSKDYLTAQLFKI